MQDERGNIWITPGSRPLYVTDNDGSVMCSDNEFQSRCNNTDEQVSSFSCMNFYNATDNYLLWFQQLQNSSIFVPSGWVYIRANRFGECPQFDLVNFYMTEVNSLSVKSVDTTRGAQLENFDSPGIINVCYNSPEYPLVNVANHLDRFVQCLAQYGTGIPWLNEF